MVSDTTTNRKKADGGGLGFRVHFVRHDGDDVASLQDGRSHPVQPSVIRSTVVVAGTALPDRCCLVCAVGRQGAAVGSGRVRERSACFVHIETAGAANLALTILSVDVVGGLEQTFDGIGEPRRGWTGSGP